MEQMFQAKRMASWKEMEIEMKSHRRDVLPDVLKGFGIVLMVLGHCIQWGNGRAYLIDEIYFESKWYQFIYSFHMPLFMAISGWYAFASARRAQDKRERWTMIGRRSARLVTLCVAWKGIEAAYLLAKDGFGRGGFAAWLKDLLVGILTSYWFLWAVLYCFLLVCLIHYKLKDSAWIYLLIFLAAFVTPDGLCLNAYKYMLPYYLIGFYGNKNRERISSSPLLKWLRKRGISVRAASAFVGGVSFFALFALFTKDTFIYLGGYKLVGKDVLSQLRVDVHRFLLGLGGVCFFTGVWGCLLRLCGERGRIVRLLAALGRKSMGFYLLSSMLIVYALFPATEGFAPNFWVNLVQTALMLSLSAAVIWGLGKVRWLRWLVE